MWPFGRKREPADETRCASCGRTLLAGEWTQRMIADDGSEVLLCSLCSQSRSSRSAAVETAMADGDQPASTNGRETKRRSDAFWLALKEKDAEIEDLRARLAQTEAEKEELLAELAVLRGASDAALEAAEPDGGGAALDSAPERDAAAPEAVSEPAAAAAPDAAPRTPAPDAAAAALEAVSEPDAAAAPDSEAAAAESIAAPAQHETAEAESIAAPAQDEMTPAVADVAAAGVAAEESPGPPVDEAREGDLEDTLPGTLSSDEILAAEAPLPVSRRGAAPRTKARTPGRWTPTRRTTT